MKRNIIITALLTYASIGYSQLITPDYKKGDEYLNYKLHSINQPKIEGMNENDNSFILYSINNLWLEDSSGSKEYRWNIFTFLSNYRYIECLSSDDIVHLLGRPDRIDTAQYMQANQPDIFYYYNILYEPNTKIPSYKGYFVFNPKGILLGSELIPYGYEEW